MSKQAGVCAFRVDSEETHDATTEADRARREQRLVLPERRIAIDVYVRPANTGDNGPGAASIWFRIWLRDLVRRSK